MTECDHLRDDQTCVADLNPCPWACREALHRRPVMTCTERLHALAEFDEQDTDEREEPTHDTDIMPEA